MLKYRNPFVGGKQDIEYTLKLLRDVFAGFINLQYSSWDGYEGENVWYDCEVIPGTRARYVAEVDPLYVYEAWGDGSRTPLPIVLEKGAGIQGWVARVLTKIAFRLDLPVLRDWRNAAVECAFYDYAHDLRS